MRPLPQALLVRELLAEYGDAARARMRQYLRDAHPHEAPLQTLVADYPERGGRALRASLCLAAASAFGARPEEALGPAVALELLHNAFLVHDDVEDESEERRGRPTLHQLHGVPVAVNVGDALAVLSLRPLLDDVARLGPHLTLRVLEEAQRMARESVEGQALELAWRQHNATDLGEADYLRMVLKKTCWYTSIYPLRIGALVGTRGTVDLERFLRFGFFVGAAFQIQDDLLNLVGDEARYGKELNGDLREGKRTLMLIHLLGALPAGERARLSRLLAAPRAERTEAELRWVRGRMERHGSLEHARRVAHGLAGAALHEFSVAYAGMPDSRDKRFLEALPTWSIERT
ncbi:polyprenyl synthetase family protein [Pyxidicoccus xibeiensis]|uniref:polyprenyl synthetase family protein n=1 Tax=Pyxidicoccus xibeiensis TaxID=2906759 RepID=UPI0020A7A1B2|nr:polyprenyl synthetase family protein [Pyxidicoccus xibeiensis]MCP3144095.1 polyprenyl synthetase family protein [Pyxidicoccus xibeiensis]